MTGVSPMVQQYSDVEHATGSCDPSRSTGAGTRRCGPVRMGLLVGSSLATLALALGPVAAQTVPARSPSTFGLTAADFSNWSAYQGDWGLAAINAATAYAHGYTGLGVSVAVVDSGIDPNHPKFAGRISSASRNFWLTDPPGAIRSTLLVDLNSHGTHVSGTIGASAAGGEMMGVAFESTLLSLNAIMGPAEANFIKQRLGLNEISTDANAAVDFAAANGARVLNGSYGPSLPTKLILDDNGNVISNPYYVQLKIQSYEYGDALAEYSALKRAADKGMLLVFAAGNEREDQEKVAVNPTGVAFYPFIRPSNANIGVYQLNDGQNRPIDQSKVDFSDLSGYIVSVVATDKNNQIGSFSNLCGVTAAWCIAAPGVGIYSTVPGGGYGLKNGTSMAAPHVSGAAAVLMQAFPFLTAPQIAQTMFTTATHLGDGPANAPNATFGWGLLNLGKAIDGPGQFTSTWTVNTTYNGQAYYGRFANDISGVGGLIKTGLGTLELAGTNSYAGGTAVYGGTLAVSRDANLGAAGTGLTLDGGTLEVLADGFATARPLTLSGPGTLQIDGGTSTFAGPIADGSQPGVLVKTGPGTAILSAANTVTGGALVGAGTLTLTATGSLAAPVRIGPAASLLNAGLVSGGVGNLGVLGNSGTIAGGLANAGLALNTGTITGGVANTGSLANSGALAGGLTNTGTALNTGAIAGGVANTGSLASSGTIAGGLTNTGTVLASAGRIDGAIANNAGLLAVSGNVASDGTLANAAGATLAVTAGGRYSLAGPLANAGIVVLAQTASLTAPAGFGNAGLVASDGTLTTDLTNTGLARLSGQLNGALTNTGLIQVTGPLAGLTTLTNAGALDLGGGALTVASLSGPASAVLGNGALTVAGPASTTYAGAILETASPTSLTQAGTGTLTLTGTGRFSGPTTIQAGTLALNGLWASPVTVAAAGTLRGIGTIAAPVTVAGALRPGNSPGTLTVLGPVAFAPGSRLGLDIDGPGTGTGAGSYARLLALGATGTVSAGGTLVPELRGLTGNATNAFTPALGQRFGVLTAQGGLSGSFTGLAQPTTGLPAGTRFDALYAATGLDLVVTPAAYGNLAGLGLSQTGNAQAVGAALDVARPAAGTRPDAARARVYDPLYAASPATLPGGLASLSGQSYGDAVMTDLSARRLIADAIDRHQRGLGGGTAAFGAGDPGLGPNRTALQVRGAAGVPDQPLAVGEGRVWADALYGFGDRAGDRAASGAGYGAGGLLVGVDRQVGAETQVGGAFSYLRETGTSRGAGLGRFTTDSYGGSLYAQTRLGPVVLRGTAGVSYADGRIDRTVALGTAVSQASGLASGWNGGVAGFAGYALAVDLPVEVVPEVGFSYDRLTRGRVAERGGLGGQGFGGQGLGGQGFAVADLDAARSLVGGRVASVAFAGVPDLRLEGRAYWAHELADTYAVVRSGLFGAQFAARTSAVGRDGAVLGVSLTGPVADGVRLTLGYTGDVRPGATAQVFAAGLQAAW
ncbi:S8 family serine peptidase [Methylobacterium sp. 092160098-2]|uniref:S8 family serine peptidase n=1 Tax=Methylobacterium sp. 092160098-2 TaxID=3025129 RepID=UPI0031583F25